MGQNTDVTIVIVIAGLFAVGILYSILTKKQTVQETSWRYPYTPDTSGTNPPPAWGIGVVQGEPYVCGVLQFLTHPETCPAMTYYGG